MIAFYKQLEDEMKNSTIDWRIYKLTEQGVLYRVFRGVYSVSEEGLEEFIPEINQSLKQLSRMILKKIPFIDICIWSTK